MSFTCNVIAVPAFKDNYIWLIDLTPADAGRASAQGRDAPVPVAIVDPGAARPVIDALAQHSLTPAVILITHHHSDHVGGVAELTLRYKIPVYGPAAEAIPGLSRRLHENDSVTLGDGNMTFTVLEVPGHTAGHIAFYGQGALFCGDTLFAGGCGKLFEGTPAQMHHSLAKLAALPDATLVYCAHEYTLNNLKFAVQVEPQNADLNIRLDEVRKRRAEGLATVPALLGVEKRTNPFLRCNTSTVIAAAEKYSGKRLNPGEDTFAVVRHWKDVAG
jgi:hydroxyacylglutathione hydrolase